MNTKRKLHDGIVGADLRVESRQGVVIVSGVQESVEHLGELFRSIARVRGVEEVVNRVRILRSAQEDLGRL